MSSGDDFEIKFYVVALIDVLGQSEHLRAWNELPPAQAPPADFVKAVQMSLGRIEYFRSMFEKYFNQCQQSTVRPAMAARLSHPQLLDYVSYKHADIQIQHFSDTFVIYCPLCNPQGDVTATPVSRMVNASAMSVLMSLAVGTPVRGAICIGLGVEVRPGHFYGPSLARCHHLEAKCADYPRIVIDESVVGFLREAADAPPSTSFSQMRARLSSETLKLIIRDPDGLACVDYLAIPWDSDRDNNLSIEKTAQKAWRFAHTEWKRFVGNGDSKHAKRYRRLLDYLEPRLSAWGIETSSISATDNPASG